MPEPVFSDTEALAALCRRHAIIRVSLFGSVLKGTAGPASDVDLLLEFMPGRAPGLLALAAIEAEFSALLGGRRVDLRTAADLSRHFRDDVISTAALQYAANAPGRAKLAMEPDRCHAEPVGPSVFRHQPRYTVEDRG